jgi:hypothetical protein
MLFQCFPQNVHPFKQSAGKHETVLYTVGYGLNLY